MTTGTPRGPGPAWLEGWLRAVSRIVPARLREDWLEEWLAEFAARRRGGDGSTMGGREALGRALGALPDAVDLRRREVGMGGSWNEVRFAARGLVRRPGLSVVSALTLALAIGAGTVLFSVAEAVLLRPLPFHEPDRLVRLWGTRQGSAGFGSTVSFPNVRDVGERSAALESVALFDEWSPALVGADGLPQVVAGGTVSASFFDVLGVEAALGRTFAPDEEGEGREPVAVLGHGLWTRSFGGDPEIVGRTITANGSAYTVVGVLPEDFETPGLEGDSFDPPEIWRTVAAFPPYRSGRSWAGMARIADGVDIDEARTDVAAAFGSLALEYPEENRGYGMDLVPLREQIVGDADRVMSVLLGAVALVLLIASANVAGLLMIRASEREGEIDVRLALGASRLRVAATAVLESMLLAGAGAALGVAIAAAALPPARRWIEGIVPRAGAVSLDGTVLGFAVGVALLTGFACGAVPAWAAVRGRGAKGVGAGARGTTEGRGAVRFRRALVTAEVALSVLLLTGGTVLVRSLDALYAVDLGIERRGVLAVELHSSAFVPLSPDEAGARYATILRELESLPGVRAAGAINILPLSGGFSCDGVDPEGRPSPPGEGRCAEIRVVLPGALEALGVPLLRGRWLDDRDREGAVGAMVVSREMADAFWPGEEVIGRRAVIHGETFEVVGVAGEVRHFGPAGVERPQAYLPAAQEPWGGFYYPFTLVVATEADPGALAPAARRVLSEIDPAIAVTSVRTLEGVLDEHLATPRFQTAVLGAFGALAVVLAMVGLSGLMAYSVRRRRREIGLRVALGADPRSIAGMVLRGGAAILAVGSVAGVAAALLTADLLSTMVFGVGVRDPWAIAGAVGLVLLTGLAACHVPARRAATVDPISALGSE